MQQENENTIQYLKRTYRRHGIMCVLHVIFLRLVNKFFEFRIFGFFLKNNIHLKAQNTEARFDRRFLTPAEVQKYFGSGFNDITAEQTKYLVSKNAKCMAVFEKETGQMAAYSWFSHQAISSGHYDLLINFDPKYVYTLKVYTAPHFRGLNLHAWQMQMALNLFQQQGYLGILGYTYSENFDSIKSNAKMGSEVIGSFWVVKLMNRVFYFKMGCLDKYKITLQKSKI